MTHAHEITDGDKRLSIDAKTRVIGGKAKVVLMQYDHESERISFELPRYIEGHDMSLASAQIHYSNGRNASRYDVGDLRLRSGDEGTVVFSWLVGGYATQNAGDLSFVVKFRCHEDGEVVYEWNTAEYVASVGKGQNNDAVIEERYPDVFSQITERLEVLESGGADEDAIAAAVEAYLTENPVETFETDHTLTLENGVLSVNTADDVEQDNTLPITSAAVHTTVGNIETLLATI